MRFEFWTFIVGIIGGIAAIIGAITGLINLFMRINENREKSSVILERHPEWKDHIAVNAVNHGRFAVHVQELFITSPQTKTTMKISFGAKSIASVTTKQGMNYSAGLTDVYSFSLDRGQNKQSAMALSAIAEKLGLSSGGSYEIATQGSLQSGKTSHSKPLLISLSQQPSVR